MSATSIAKATAKSLESLGRLMVKPPVELAVADLSQGMKSAGVPERFASGESDSLIISGDEFKEFRRSLRQLSREPSTEHLSPRELETELWDLCCELFFERELLSDAAKRKSRIKRFVSNVTKHWEPFECAFSIAELKLACPKMQIGDVQFVQWDDVPADWRIQGRDEIADEMKGHCVAINVASGGDIEQAAQRARTLVDRALDALRLGITQTIYVRVSDPELVFRRAEYELIRKLGGTSAARFNWSFKDRPITTTLGADRVSAIEEYLSPIVSPRKGQSREFADRIRLAARWMGASAVKPDVDDKVVALCTAVEALLASKSDRLKGEVIAIRSMLLPLSIEEGFTDPFPLYALYSRRSDIIHGSKLGVCGEEDYRLLHFEATLILKHMLAVLKKHPELKRFEDLVRLVETVGALEHAENWFARYGKFAKDVVKAAQERRKLAQARETTIETDRN